MRDDGQLPRRRESTLLAIRSSHVEIVVVALIGVEFHLRRSEAILSRMA